MDYRAGQVVEGTVTAIRPYGAFVQVDEQTTGLIHISEISERFVRDVSHFVKVGEKVVVKVIDVDREKHQLKLSLKAVAPPRRAAPRYRGAADPADPIGFAALRQALPHWIAQQSIDPDDEKE
jgi:predicted RNA-binding protein with RPS1 domain